MTATITPLAWRSARPLSPAADERLSTALEAARRAGFLEGERAGYIAGWRWGVVCWLCLGFLAGAATVAACVRLGYTAGLVS